MKENHRKVYIQAAEQISMQQPLSEQWMEEPQYYTDGMVKAVNPPFRDYMAANEVRRTGGLMKRALATALKVLRATGVEHPDAIVTGTGLGSLDYTERFLDDMVENGEEALSPTLFMQTTHNTVGAALGIYTKTHGYNSTYSHGGISFELALMDAWMQLQTGSIHMALVGGHDEMVESYYNILRTTEYVGVKGMVPCSEVAVSMLLTSPDPSQGGGSDGSVLCEVAGISVAYKASAEDVLRLTEQMLGEADMTMEDVSAVMTGVNGNPANDIHYRNILDHLFPHLPHLHYKHVFGENYTASALGVYAAAHCLERDVVPPFLYDDASPCQCDSLKSILLLNQAEGRDLTLLLLKRL